MTAMKSALVLLMKPAKPTDLFLIDLIFIRFPVKRLVLGPGFTLTSPEKINNKDTHGLTRLKECDLSLYCQEGIVDHVETWVNARLKLCGGKGRESEMQT